MPAPSSEIDLKPYPPAGFDRADGSERSGGGNFPGTATPADLVVTRTANGSAQYIEELPDSPTIERGEQTTCVHSYRCDPETAKSIIQFTSRGDIQMDSDGLLWKVLTSRMSYAKGGSAVVTITSEYTGSTGLIQLDTPPDEFTIDVIEFNPALMKHPRYSPIKLKNKYKIQKLVNSGDILKILDLENTVAFNSDVEPGSTEGLAMQELICKLRKGIDSFYLAGFRVNYSVYSNFPQLMNPGGYVENPIDSALIPYYFTSQDQTPDGQSIFDMTDGNGDPLYPMMYGATDGDGNLDPLTWFRVSDTQTYQRTWFKQTRSWIAAPGGGDVNIGDEPFNWFSTWDEDIYSKSFGGYETRENQ